MCKRVDRPGDVQRDDIPHNLHIESNPKWLTKYERTNRCWNYECSQQHHIHVIFMLKLEQWI